MRKLVLIILLLLLCVVGPRPQRVESGASLVFPVSLSGKTWQTDIAFGPGFKVTPGKVTDKIVNAILLGNKDDYSKQFLDLLNADPSGRLFLYFDGRNADGSTSWRVATNPNGVGTTTLNGVMTQDGLFWLSGQYTLPVLGTMADFFLAGKAKFAKGTFNPTKIAGTAHFLSNAAGTGCTVKFKTVGAPLS